MTSARCTDVHAFADGELSTAECDAFRAHLVDCARCRAELHDLVQLEVRALQRIEAPIDLAAARTRTRRLHRSVAVVAIGAAAAAVAIVVSRGPAASPPERPSLALAAHRSIEPRVSAGDAAAFRRYDVLRGGGGAEPLPLATLSRLEQLGDRHGLGVAYLLGGDAARAEATLAALGDTPEIASDRAAALIVAGDPAGAIAVLDRAIGASPELPAARWNRALALRDLGLPLSAAAAFDEVAAREEPGWSGEARDRAAELRRTATVRGDAFRAMLRRGRSFDVSIEDVRATPGLTRLFLYDALRSATSRERALALEPFARELDRIQGGDVLATYARRVAGADFARRAPLAADYARLASGGAPPAERAALVERLRRGGEVDLTLGALMFSGSDGRNVAPELLSDYVTLARAEDDRWFHFLASDQEADAAVGAGRWDRAEAILVAAIARCRDSWMAYRCVRLEHDLGQLYLTLHRVSDASRVIHDAWEHARREGDHNTENKLLMALAEVAHFADDTGGSGLSLVRAYLGELLLREPTSCAMRSYVHEAIAKVLVNRLDLEAARAELASAISPPGCPAPGPTLHRAFVASQIVVERGRPGEVDRVRGELAALRAGGELTAGELAFADHVEGRIAIRTDRAGGTALLRRAIEAARRAPSDDLDARRAQAYSYSVLAMQAGRDGDHAGALALLAEELGVDAPGRCAVAVAIEDGVLVAARDAGGRAIGSFRPLATTAVDESTLVDGEILKALEPCDVVDVLARPPLFGRPRLLPARFAWRFRTGPAPASSPAPQARRRLVVSGVDAPAALGLPRLGPTETSHDPHALHLSGGAATPSRVLAEAELATEIELHAHGLVDLAQSEASFVVLAPDAQGDYALTAAALRDVRLRGAPFVFLGACHASRPATRFHEAWSLPSAFRAAGARTVVAASAPLPDGDVDRLLASLRARLASGVPAAVALRDERLARLAEAPTSWVTDLMVFE